MGGGGKEKGEGVPDERIGFGRGVEARERRVNSLTTTVDDESIAFDAEFFTGVPMHRSFPGKQRDSTEQCCNKEETFD